MNASLPEFWFRDPWYFLAALIVPFNSRVGRSTCRGWITRGGKMGAFPRRDLISRWLADTVGSGVSRLPR